MVLSPEILYVYRQRKGSIVYSKYVDNRLDYLKMITHRAKVLRDLEPETVSEKLYGRCMERLCQCRQGYCPQCGR